MKLGLLTAAFPDLTLEEVAAWAAEHGFEALEVACWPAGGGERRRYAGVAHIDVDALDPDDVRATLDRYGLSISALAYYPNNLDPDDEQREHVNAHLRKVIDAAQRLGVDVVGTFVGNDKDRPLPENLDRFRKIWPPLVHYAGERGVKIAIENCPMIFSLGRVAGRHQPRLGARDLGRAVQRDPRRELRSQPRPVAPRLADDRLRACGLRLRRPHLPRAREGHGGQQGRPVPARHLLGRHGLAGAAPPRSRRGELAAVRRGALRRRLRQRRSRSSTRTGASRETSTS